MRSDDFYREANGWDKGAVSDLYGAGAPDTVTLPPSGAGRQTRQLRHSYLVSLVTRPLRGPH